MKNLFKKWFGKKEKESKTCCGCCKDDVVDAPIKSDKKGEEELIGLILLIIGIITICAFILPSKIWLIVLGGIMIFCGFKLFV